MAVFAFIGVGTKNLESNWTNLQPEYSFDLIEKAGFRLLSTPEHLIYRSILQTMYREKLSTIQKLLKDSGCSELNLKDLCA